MTPLFIDAIPLITLRGTDVLTYSCSPKKPVCEPACDCPRPCPLGQM